MPHEMPFAMPPVDQQVLAEEHRDNHAIDDRKARAALLPGLQIGGRIAPSQSLGVEAKGAMPRDAGVTHQCVLVELTPQQLVDPCLSARAAAVELASVARQDRVQAMEWRDHARSEIGRKLAGSGLGGQVAQLRVVFDDFVDEALQPLASFLLTRRPAIAQVHGFDAVLAADFEHASRRIRPSGDLANQQWNVQRLQRLAQQPQVAQPKVDLAGRVVMGQPLPGAGDPEGHGRAALAGCRQGGVVVDTQVTA
ncbi:hypothetical protein WR25_16093 [Diploscapter pachys]|uniref:Uncharacterized protein n=1 Tax=Diploscapter pachys TaxID=2018661 RepID=A0A2A2KBW8_9BILA|nr:hypothetical protein WR25_16093 [Diploscapter pachys]